MNLNADQVLHQNTRNSTWYHNTLIPGAPFIEGSDSLKEHIHVNALRREANYREKGHVCFNRAIFFYNDHLHICFNPLVHLFYSVYQLY